MTRIAFYVCPTTALRQRLLLACKLTHKARERGMHVYIHTDSWENTEQMDEMLWTWNDLSFIPHRMAPGDTEVLLGHDYTPENHCDYLINLSTERPEFFARFERMAEILDQTPEILNNGRTRYRFYHDRGYELNYHKL